MPAASHDDDTAGALLEVRDLCTVFAGEEGVARAVDGASFTVCPGETVGLVGESGCGKTVTALSILGLVPAPAGRIAGGDILFRGRSLLGLPADEMRRRRGSDISMVFQEPTSALNPVLTCGEQVAEVLREHCGCGRRQARRHAIDMLRRVHLPDPERQAQSYPHQLSGGMCQRVMLAMALACRPSLLIADEPTTALDVTIQAQILELLQELQADERMAILLITHDLAVVAAVADRVAVMYAGRVVESGSIEQVFESPRHPYTQGLLASLPSLETRPGPLAAIPGTVPHPARLPSYCRFYDRCRHRQERCFLEDPPPTAVAPGHLVRCLVAPYRNGGC